MPSKYLWLFDSGHGGLIDGNYQTSDKRSSKCEDGGQLHEGEFNRAIVQRLISSCTHRGINCINLVDGYFDIPLSERVRIANNIYRKRLLGAAPIQHCIYVSVHANAHTPGHSLAFNNARGWEVFTSRGETKSDKIAIIFAEKMKEAFPEASMKKDGSDGNPDKELSFYVLKNTVMPAVLTGNSFMTNKKEAELLLSESGRDKIAMAHFEAIKLVEKLYLFS